MQSLSKNRRDERCRPTALPGRGLGILGREAVSAGLFGTLRVRNRVAHRFQLLF